MPTSKPLHTAAIVEFARTHRRLVVAENHRDSSGGLMGLVAETLCDHNLARRFFKVGLADIIGDCGSADYLEAKFGWMRPP